MNQKNVIEYLTQAILNAKMAKQVIERSTREGDWTPTFEVLEPMRQLSDILESTAGTIAGDLGSYRLISPQSKHFVSNASIKGK